MEASLTAPPQINQCRCCRTSIALSNWTASFFTLYTDGYNEHNLWYLMKTTTSIARCTLLLILLSSPLLRAADAPQALIVYAAASLTNALDEVGTRYTSETGQPVKFSYGASSTLARQIEAGAKADIFFSADNDWMDYLQERNLINKGSRQARLGNTLVLIAPSDSKVQLKIAPGFALSSTLGDGKLSVADPDTVPAGKYAKAALIKLGIWNSVTNKIARADNVRTALIFVERAETPLGIVYETDALIDNKVRIIDRFPADTHPAIVYPVSLIASANPDGQKFIAYMNGAVAKVIFKKYGFTTPP